MSKRTRKINKVTGTVISISLKIIAIIFIVLVLVRGSKIAFDFGHSIFYEEGVEEAPGRDVSVTLPDDVTVNEAADIFYSRGLINNKISFKVQAKVFDLAVVPGTYTFNTSQSARQMLEALNKGPADND